jgi:hypothetical protein
MRQIGTTSREGELTGKPVEEIWTIFKEKLPESSGQKHKVEKKSGA